MATSFKALKRLKNSLMLPPGAVTARDGEEESMPIYEYHCPNCNREFEVMRAMSQASEPALCPTCGTSGERLVSVFASKADYTIKVPSKDAFRKREG